MSLEKINVPNFILGGTFKAGTTSVFKYLADHPEVCASNLKEPSIFLNHYGKYFKTGRYSIADLFNLDAKPLSIVFMEGTVEYLECAATAAERIHFHVNEPKLLFILRDPVERLSSFYHFFLHSQLKIPEKIDFTKYIQLCFDSIEGPPVGNPNPMKDRYLRALPAGLYNLHIREFLKIFERDQILVLFYEHLKIDPLSFMDEICSFLKIDPSFFLKYNFEKKNVTYKPKFKLFHTMVWNVYQNFLIKHIRNKPSIKDPLLSLYKKMNTKRTNFNQMDVQLRNDLIAYYQQSKDDLQTIVGKDKNIPWNW